MTDFVTLGCPSCGGRLQITSDLDRFACAYCGTEHLVRRGQGVVSLEPVVEHLANIQAGIENVNQGIASVNHGIGEVHQDMGHVKEGIGNVHQGVDKTASELAIQRLRPELEQLNRQYLQQCRIKPSGGGFMFGCGLTIVILMALGGIAAIFLFVAFQHEQEAEAFLLALIPIAFLFFVGLILFIVGIVRKSGVKRAHRDKLSAMHQQLQAKRAEIQRHYDIIG
jgi:hypothetical protein